jgi:transcriptional regulator of acetoin/glycerol metabolism
MAPEDEIRAVDLGLVEAESTRTTLEEMTLEEVEKVLMQKALRRHEGNVSRAAEALGISRSAFYRRMQKYGL